MKKLFNQISTLVKDNNQYLSFTITHLGFVELIVEISYDDCYAYYSSKFDSTLDDYSPLTFVGNSPDHITIGSSKDFNSTFNRIKTASKNSKK